MSWAQIAKLGDLSIGLIAAVIIVKLVLDFAAKRKVKEQLGESKAPELLAAETLTELRKLGDTFDRHDKQDRAEFRRLLEEMQKSDDHLSSQIGELRDEIRANRGSVTELEKGQAVHDYRIKALEDRAR